MKKLRIILVILLSVLMYSGYAQRKVRADTVIIRGGGSFGQTLLIENKQTSVSDTILVDSSGWMKQRVIAIGSGFTNINSENISMVGFLSADGTWIYYSFAHGHPENLLITEGGFWDRTGNFLFPKTIGDSVGINDNTPSYLLDVNGDARFVGNTIIGETTPDETTPSFSIRADADSDAADVTETLTLSLTQNADPDSSRWDFTSTQSVGYGFDKDIHLDKSGTGEKINLRLTGEAINTEIIVEQFGGTQSSDIDLEFIRYGGTVASRTTSAAGWEVMSLNANAWDGNSVQRIGEVKIDVGDVTVGVGKITGKFRVQLTDSLLSRDDVLIITPDLLIAYVNSLFKDDVTIDSNLYVSDTITIGSSVLDNTDADTLEITETVVKISGIIATDETIKTISTNQDLVINPNGTGVISVLGTTDYENNVTHDDDIPNLKKLTDFVGNSTFWSQTLGHIYPTTETDSVGVGTNSPKAILEVAGRIEISGTGNSVMLGGGAGLNDDLDDNENVFIGDSAGKSNTIGFTNTAVGHKSFYSNIGGIQNTALGDHSLYSNTSGSSNMAIGGFSFHSNTTGQWNTAIGIAAGRYAGLGVTLNEENAYNTFIGYNTRSATTTDTNQTVIGANAVSNGSNTITAGDDNVTDVWMNEDGTAIVHAGEYMLGTDYKIIIFNDTMCGVKISTTDTVRIVPIR